MSVSFVNDNDNDGWAREKPETTTVVDGLMADGQ